MRESDVAIPYTVNLVSYDSRRQFLLVSTSWNKFMKCDILLQGGEVIDPSQELHTVCDVVITEGRVAAVEDDLGHLNPATRIDARGLLVTPGLIDMHVHVYPHTSIGLDANQLCLSGGVTTMLDAGSAGSLNFNAFRSACAFGVANS